MVDSLYVATFSPRNNIKIPNLDSPSAELPLTKQTLML